MKVSLKHLSMLLSYIAVGFVVRSIGHGFFSNNSSVISGIVGFILFLISHLLDQKVNPIYDTDGNRIKSNLPKAIIISLLFLSSVSLVVGGFQYFFNNPYASLMMIPIGYIISLWTYPIKKRLYPVSRWKIIPLSIIIGGLLYIALNGIIHTIPSNWYNINSTGSMVHQDYKLGAQEIKKSVNNLRGITDGRFEFGFLQDLFDKSLDSNLDNINIVGSGETRPNRMDGYSDKDIYTHCIAIPSMEGCPDFLSSYTGDTELPTQIIEQSTIMDHSSMIKNEFDFLALMIPHHQEAVDHSINLLKLPSISPQLKPIVENIILSQNTEIRSMLGWLDSRYSGAVYTGESYIPMMRDTSNISNISTIESIYVQDMIGHHKGAIQMAEKVLTFSGIHEETKALAESIIKNQTTEMSILENILNKGKISNKTTIDQDTTIQDKQYDTTTPNTNTIYPSER